MAMLTDVHIILQANEVEYRMYGSGRFGLLELMLFVRDEGRVMYLLVV